MTQDPPPSPPGEIEEAVRAVFADPELRRGLHTNGSSSADLWQRLEAWLRQLLLDLDALRHDSPALYVGLLALLVAILALLLGHIAWTLRRALRGAPPEPTAVAAAAGGARALLSRELRAQARALADAGRYREAVRTLLLALLALVEERHVLRVARGWTNREITHRLAARLGGDDARLAAFDAVAARACYGGTPPAASDFAAMDALLAALAGEVRR